MATLKNTIKKAEKITGQKIQKNSNHQYWVSYKGYTMSFCANGAASDNAEAICFYASKRERTPEDIMTDYFPGFFRENLSQLVKSVNHMTK